MNIVCRLLILLIIPVAAFACTLLTSDKEIEPENTEPEPEEPQPPPPLIDIDGNEYGTVILGDQVWMTENLRVTRYRDGSTIHDYSVYPHEKVPGIGSVGQMVEIFGYLYAHGEARSGQLCPEGWRIPDMEDWFQLRAYLRGKYGADIELGGKLKATGTEFWRSPNKGGTNETGFSALPGGWYHSVGEFYSGFGSEGHWLSTDHIDVEIGTVSLQHDDDVMRLRYIFWHYAWLSARCLRDL